MYKECDMQKQTPFICFPQANKSDLTWMLVFLLQPLNVHNRYLPVGQRVAKPQKNPFLLKTLLKYGQIKMNNIMLLQIDKCITSV